MRIVSTGLILTSTQRTVGSCEMVDIIVIDDEETYQVVLSLSFNLPNLIEWMKDQPILQGLYQNYMDDDNGDLDQFLEWEHLDFILNNYSI